jgi:CHAT domain-containing protein
VPDKATSELMTAFYSRYFKGTRPVEAMRASQLDMIAKLRKETGSAPPYYWGAFVVGR